MNWRWILMLAAVGVLLSIAGIYGWIPDTGMWISIGLLLIFAILLGYNVRQKLFLHGFLTAVIWVAVSGVLQFVLWDTFVENNPRMMERMAEVPEGMDVRTMATFGMVVGALINGAILGLLTLLAGKLLGEKPAPEPSLLTDDVSDNPEQQSDR